MTSIIHRCRSGLAWIAIVLLCACGGGGGSSGGGGGGGGNSNPPYIIASLISFPTALAAPPGFFATAHNSGIVVQIADQQGGNNISNAVVTLNGTSVPYQAATLDYEAELDVAPGADVTLSVRVNGTTYTATGRQFTAYPTITAPLPGTTWSAADVNLVGWTGAAPNSTSQYLSGIFDTTGQLVWPTNGALQAVDTSQQSYNIGVGSLTTGNRLVLVGVADLLTMPNTATGSGFAMTGFNYSSVTVVASIATLQSISVVPDSAVVGPGATRQLAATGHYSDFTSRDITMQVSWQSTDATKVAVDPDGLVTGIASGAATITAQLSGFTGSTTITVFQPDPSPVPPLTEAVAYQIDYAHSGRATVGGSGPVFPANAAWSVTLNGFVSYPLVAGGKVFVLTNVNATTPGDPGTTLYALDEATGAVVWGPLTIQGSTNWSGHAYDHGQLFVKNYDGLVRTFDADTGTPGWTQSETFAGLSAPPVAANGVLYVAGGGHLYALDESNGNTLWQSGVAGIGPAAPTVTSDGVFIAYACQVYRFELLASTQVWHYDGGCEGGGGRTAAYASGQLFTRDSTFTPRNTIFDAATGNQAGTFDAAYIPAFSAQSGFFLTSDINSHAILNASDLATGNPLWSHTDITDLITAPIVIDNAVVLGSTSGTVYAFDATTGNVLWSASAGASIYGPDEQNAGAPLTGLGVGDGYLVVPAGNVLTAWRVAP